jgi:Flp pilus assembly protein TadD
MVPDLAVAFTQRGSALCDIGEFHKAISDFSQAIRLNPQDPANYVCRGVALDELGRFNETIQDFTKAIELDATDPASFFSRALAYHKLGKIDLAVADYRATLQLSPDFPRAKQNLDLAITERGTNRFRKTSSQGAPALKLQNKDTGFTKAADSERSEDAAKPRESAKIMDIFTKTEIK